MADFQFAVINNIASGRFCLVATRPWCSLNFPTPENTVRCFALKFSYDLSVSYIFLCCIDFTQFKEDFEIKKKKNYFHPSLSLSAAYF